MEEDDDKQNILLGEKTPGKNISSFNFENAARVA
jgi:hypothetical protein